MSRVCYGLFNFHASETSHSHSAANMHLPKALLVALATISTDLAVAAPAATLARHRSADIDVSVLLRGPDPRCVVDPVNNEGLCKEWVKRIQYHNLASNVSNLWHSNPSYYPFLPDPTDLIPENMVNLSSLALPDDTPSTSHLESDKVPNDSELTDAKYNSSEIIHLSTTTGPPLDGMYGPDCVCCNEPKRVSCCVFSALLGPLQCCIGQQIYCRHKPFTHDHLAGGEKQPCQCQGLKDCRHKGLWSRDEKPYCPMLNVN